MVVVGVARGEVAGVVRGAGDDEGGEPDAEVAEVGGGVIDRGEAGGLALDGDGGGDGALDVNDLQEQRLNTGATFEAGRDGRAGGVVIYALLGVEGDLDEFVFSEARRGDIGEAVAAFRTEVEGLSAGEGSVKEHGDAGAVFGQVGFAVDLGDLAGLFEVGAVGLADDAKGGLELDVVLEGAAGGVTQVSAVSSTVRDGMRERYWAAVVSMRMRSSSKESLSGLELVMRGWVGRGGAGCCC